MGWISFMNLSPRAPFSSSKLYAKSPMWITASNSRRATSDSRSVSDLALTSPKLRGGRVSALRAAPRKHCGQDALAVDRKCENSIAVVREEEDSLSADPRVSGASTRAPRSEKEAHDNKREDSRSGRKNGGAERGPRRSNPGPGLRRGT